MTVVSTTTSSRAASSDRVPSTVRNAGVRMRAVRTDDRTEAVMPGAPAHLHAREPLA